MMVVKVAGSGIACAADLYRGVEFLKATRRAKTERALLGCLALTCFYALSAVWEMMQVLQHVGLESEDLDSCR